MRSNRRWGAMAAALMLALALVACGGDGDGGDATGSTGSTGTTASTGSTKATGTTDTDGGLTSVRIDGNVFEPAELDVAAGTVSLSVTNDDAIPHTFTTDDMVVNEAVRAGETVEVTVEVAEDLGWHCEIHPSMRGTFVVT